MSGLLSLLIAVIVIALICYILFWALAQIPLPQPIRAVITVLVAIILIVWIVNRFGLLAGL
jgi:hypothetical protein